MELKYNIDRKVWDILWCCIMNDFTGWFDEYENDIFHIKPYDWRDDNEDDIHNEWHFWHKPSGFKIQWYKHPLRGATCNMQISDAQFVDVLHDCYNSMQNYEGIKITHNVDKWWKD